MNNPISAQVQYFHRILTSWKIAVAHVSIEYVAILAQESWVLSTARVSLLPAPLSKDVNDIVSTGRLRVGQLKKSVTMGELEQLIEDATAGKVTISEIQYGLGDDGKLSLYSPAPADDTNYFVPQLEVRLDRTSMLSQDINLSEINAELRIAERPFDGLTDLLGHYNLGSNGYLPQEQKITMHLIPALELYRDKCMISDGLLILALRKSTALAHEKIAIGLRQLPGAALARRSQISRMVSWAPGDDGFELGHLELKLDNCSAAELMVSVDGHSAMRVAIEDKNNNLNPRLKIYRRYDASLAQLREHLFPEERKSKNLEVGVATLLHLLGASSVKMLPTDATDVIAETLGGRLVIIECTVKMDDPAKITKLANRRNALVFDHDGAGQTREVLALLVVCRPRNQISFDADELSRNQIILIAKEEIETALSRLSSPPDLDALYVQMSNSFPQHSKDVFGIPS